MKKIALLLITAGLMINTESGMVNASSLDKQNSLEQIYSLSEN